MIQRGRITFSKRRRLNEPDSASCEGVEPEDSSQKALRTNTYKTNPKLASSAGCASGVERIVMST